jgi:diaminohydroxyphosphoribosylaminopyrimidine deaminase/5-amino-6-(5-phosphoribosylamino)uracil reductase
MSENARATDERMLRRALALALLGTGTAAPNPRVGAVLVRGDRVIGQGYHRRPGNPHAEAIALDQASGSRRAAEGATLYTTLEPCCHTGRTPPCVARILDEGVARVVASMIDPDPKVNGGGFRALRRGGVAVEVGLLRAEALRLNEGFVKHARRGRPLVTLKGAVSLDGRIATGAGESKWITSPLPRRHARLLRAEHEAVVVGIGTVLADDPRLDRRGQALGTEIFVRAVLDRTLRTPPASRLVAGRSRGRVVVFCGPGAPSERRARLEAASVEVVPVGERDGRLDLEEVLDHLGALGITSVLVEGGGEVHGSFLDRRLADRLVLYLAPKILGGRSARPIFGGEGAAKVKDALELRWARCAPLGDGWLLEGGF